ncbi:MAG: hypothetical protein E7073_00315 [Bacteroidales bacterium]|jgi:hypothetical protein|nr:hypothetical protein [Bacteroidales bacterium]
MKKIETLAMMLATALCLSLTSCSDDKDSGRDTNAAVTSSDPIGTMAANLRNDNGDWVEIYNYDNDGYNHIWIDINGSNNLFFRAVSYNMNQEKTTQIVSVGPVKNIAAIKTVPEAGWTNAASAQPGCGYIAKRDFEGTTVYARIYVVEWMENTYGGIIGARIKYQVWKP